MAVRSSLHKYPSLSPEKVKHWIQFTMWLSALKSCIKEIKQNWDLSELRILYNKLSDIARAAKTGARGSAKKYSVAILLIDSLSQLSLIRCAFKIYFILKVQVTLIPPGICLKPKKHLRTWAGLFSKDTTRFLLQTMTMKMQIWGGSQLLAKCDGDSWWRAPASVASWSGLSLSPFTSNQHPIQAVFPNILLNRGAHLAITLTSNTSQCCGRWKVLILMQRWEWLCLQSCGNGYCDCYCGY